MKFDLIVKNARLVNRLATSEVDIALKDGKIVKIADHIDGQGTIHDVEGRWVIPGVIDDQVHFREPGLTHKANIESEARAGIAGGVTSYMEMPNTKPPALTRALLEDKYAIAHRTSLANYSFYMGVSNDNLEEALRVNPEEVCGLKVFMGSSTGNMLVDDEKTLEDIFRRAHLLIATHCEDEETIRRNTEMYVQRLGSDIPADLHPVIRSREACYLSSSKAVEMAMRYQTRLHVLHISTREEVGLFDNDMHRSKKRITAEACVHHLTFCDEDYALLGHLIKCNPAIKEAKDREAIWKGLLDDRIDVIATDHAPHTWEEKQGNYMDAPSGLPLIQHSLSMMLDKVHDDVMSLGVLVDKMCHAPADIFGIKDRGYLDEGYWGDMVVLDFDNPLTIHKENIFYKCGWSPLEGRTLRGVVRSTYVNGHRAYHLGRFDEGKKGKRLTFTAL